MLVYVAALQVTGCVVWYTIVLQLVVYCSLCRLPVVCSFIIPLCCSMYSSTVVFKARMCVYLSGQDL